MYTLHSHLGFQPGETPGAKVQQKSAELHGKSPTQSFHRRRHSTPCITAYKQLQSHVDTKGAALRRNWSDTYNSDHQKSSGTYEVQHAKGYNEELNSICESIPTLDLAESMSSLMTCLTETSVYKSPNSSLTPAESSRSTSPIVAQFLDSEEIPQPMQPTDLFGNNYLPPLCDTEFSRLRGSPLLYCEHRGNSLVKSENNDQYNRKDCSVDMPETSSNNRHETTRSDESTDCSPLPFPESTAGLPPSSSTSEMMGSSSSTVATIQLACLPPDMYLLQELFFLRDMVQEMQLRNGILRTELEKQKDPF